MKKFLTLCALAVAFAAQAQVPVRPDVDSDAAPYLLYWDGEKLNVGQWGTVSHENMLFTKFGSVVAFTTTSNSDEWDAGDVKFNPTNILSFPDYKDIPSWSGKKHTDYDDGYISAAGYHNNLNLEEGKGDICRLVGLTPVQARELALAGKLDSYDSGFRLPTKAEYKAEYPYYWGEEDEKTISQWVVVPARGRWLESAPGPESFLPASGYRPPHGEPYNVHKSGYYWTSKPSNSEVNNFGEFMNFDRQICQYGGSSANNGQAIRCIPNK